MAGGSETHAFPLTSGMILTQIGSIRVLSHLPGLSDYGIELGAWSQLSHSEHCLRQLLELWRMIINTHSMENKWDLEDLIGIELYFYLPLSLIMREILLTLHENSNRLMSFFYSQEIKSSLYFFTDVIQHLGCQGPFASERPTFPQRYNFSSFPNWSYGRQNLPAGKEWGHDLFSLFLFSQLTPLPPSSPTW